MNGHEVHVRRRFDPHAIEIWVVDRRGRVLQGRGWVEPDPPNSITAPTLVLDKATAEALWRELTHELRLDTKLSEGTQREDYLHERNRVDNLVSFITSNLRSRT